MKKYILAAITTGAVLAAGSVSALTYNIIDPTPLPSGGLGTPFVGDYEALFGVGDVGFGLVVGAFTEEEENDIGFSFFDEESGFENLFTFGEWGSIADPSGDTAFSYTGGADFFSGADMIFTWSNPLDCCTPPEPANAEIGQIGFGIFFDIGDVDGKSNTVFLAYADRAAAGDSDYSDLVIETTGDVNVVPLPAAGWMLIAGLGGLAAMRRRKQLS